MFIALPDAVLHVIQRLNEAGFEAYVVGGCVRDSLMGKSPDDWDITTSAMPDEMQILFKEYRCIETGLQHGTLTVLVENMPLEITTYRVDGGYSDGRHPDSVDFTHSLAEDLRRRDFTVNAMAYHPKEGVVDLYDGQKDIRNGTIRCVGDAEQRFGEDALRILRALRFASTLEFSLDDDTALALRQLFPTLSRVAIERIAVELQKLLCGRDVYRVVSEYQDVLSALLPELARITDMKLLLNVPAVPHVRFAALFWTVDCSVEKVVEALRRLRLDNHTMDTITRLLTCRDWPMDTDSDFLRLLNWLDKELIFDYLALRMSDRQTIQRMELLLSTGVCYKLSMLKVNGNDLIAAGVNAGPDIGRVLRMLLDAVIRGDCSNEKSALLNYIEKIKKPVQ